MARSQPQAMVATESFAVEMGQREDGTPVMRLVLAGSTRLNSDDPLVKGRESLFTNRMIAVQEEPA